VKGEEKRTYTSDDSALLGVGNVAEDVLEGSVEAVADVAAEDAVRGSANGGSDRVDNLVEGLVKAGTGGLERWGERTSARATKGAENGEAVEWGGTGAKGKRKEDVHQRR
jgi:hypothetical protein